MEKEYMVERIAEMMKSVNDETIEFVYWFLLDMLSKSA